MGGSTSVKRSKSETDNGFSKRFNAKHWRLIKNQTQTLANGDWNRKEWFAKKTLWGIGQSFR